MDEKPTLFENPYVREKKYWQFIKMVAASKHPKSSRGWTAEDCVGLYCEKCETRFKYTKNDSKPVTRHMTTYHAQDLYLSDRPDTWLAVKNPSDQPAGHSNSLRPDGRPQFGRTRGRPGGGRRQL